MLLMLLMPFINISRLYLSFFLIIIKYEILFPVNIFQMFSMFFFSIDMLEVS